MINANEMRQWLEGLGHFNPDEIQEAIEWAETTELDQYYIADKPSSFGSQGAMEYILCAHKGYSDTTKWPYTAVTENKSLSSRIDNILQEKPDPGSIEEGMVIAVNKVISNAIRVPEGSYIVAVVNSDSCVLIPTSEASKERFEVFKPTLAGFFNPEIHRKIIEPKDSPVIAES